ncbi:MAG: hypothetical protein QOI95_3076 [Acidimicrobiaceae bacterium]|jgi:hypothetical protein
MRFRASVGPHDMLVATRARFVESRCKRIRADLAASSVAPIRQYALLGFVLVLVDWRGGGG